MMVELLVAVSLPVWLCVEEIARLRGERSHPVADRQAAGRKPQREALPAKA